MRPPSPVPPVSLALSQEKTGNSTPYWRVTAFLQGAALPKVISYTTCTFDARDRPQKYKLRRLKSHMYCHSYGSGHQIINKSQTFEALSTLLLIAPPPPPPMLLKIKGLYNTPVKKCDTEISIVLLVSCRRCSSSSLPPLPGHLRANRLIRQLIAAFSLSAGPLSFVFSFSLHVIL